MNYQETLHYLYTQLPMFQRQGPIAFKKDLGNIRKLCKALGNPQNQFKSIHIAGTNGKGSSSHILSALLQQSNAKVGLYTSPHYKDFRERIKINDALIEERAVVEFVKEHKVLFEKIRPSFFEITVALAFDYFAKSKVDIAVIETGLGGRLDSTNILSPELCMITNISLDHQSMLGNTLKAIAKEKAGIIKKNTPVIIGEYQASVFDVFEKKAAKENAKLIKATKLCRLENYNYALYESVFDLKIGKETIKNIKSDITAPYQSANLQSAIACYLLWQKQNGISFDAAPLRKAMANIRNSTYFLGRWQLIAKQDKLVLCDSAHNIAGIELLIRAIEERSIGSVHVVFGTVSDKDPSEILKAFPGRTKFYFAKAKIPRGMPADDLNVIAKKMNRNGKGYTSVRRALSAAIRSSRQGEVILVCGSIFVVAEVI